MNKLRKQSDSTYPLFFLMVDSTDHITGKTNLILTVTISKNGGSFASPSGAVTEVGNGLYKIAGNATDSNTVGELWIHATGTGADPTDTSYTIVAYDPFDSVRLGLTALPNAAAEAAGGLYTRGSGAGQINQPANGQIDANAVKVGGTTQTGRDIGASVLLSSGTGTGQISLSSGAVLLQATQTGVTIPTVTNLTNAPTNGDLTATMKTSVTTAATAATPIAASVTGAVGSVTGNVGGNVTGSVGSVVAVVSANVTQINGSATNGNNATLSLKKLSITNTDFGGYGIEVTTTTAGGAGGPVKLSGSGSGNIGLEINAYEGMRVTSTGGTNNAVTLVPSVAGYGLKGSISGNITGNLSGSVGSISTVRPKKNTGLDNFMFPMFDSTTKNPKIGLTVTAERAIDGNPFSPCSNAAVELSNGVYRVNLSASDLNGNKIMLRFSSPGADDQLVEIITQD